MQLSESYLKPEQRNSKFMKRELAHHCYWRLGYSVVIDEFQFMDLFGVNRSGYGIEFEIKVSKSDFDREIKCIKMLECKHYGKDWEKFSKHRFYLTGKLPQTNYDQQLNDLGISNNINDNSYIPNEFYFYVPDYLTEYALKKLEGLPYGLIQIGKTSHNGGISSFFWVYEKIKKATKLHNNKVNDGLYSQLAHSLTVRSKLLNGEGSNSSQG
jgi:hypothetical protein